MLQLTFLGTSAGVPTKQRNVTALAVECLNPYQDPKNAQQNKKGRPWVLIDCGEGTQQQLLRTKLSLHQLLAIAITHVHGDHCYGLPGLLASAAMSGRTTPLTIIAPQAIAAYLEAIKSTTELHLSFAIDFIAIEDILANKNPSAYKHKQSSVNKKASDESTEHQLTITLDNQHSVAIDITKLSHRVPSHAFAITQTISQRVLNTDKLKSQGITPSKLWGELQQGQDVYTDAGQRLLSADYVHDNKRRTRIVVAGDNDTPTCLSAAVKDTNLLIHEATYTTDVLANIQDKTTRLNTNFDPMHSSAKQIAQFAEKSEINNLILTHFSARYQSFDEPQSRTANMGHIRKEAESVYQGNLWLAEDFAQYRVDGADNKVDYLGSARKG
ncbi:ribonuclease Z [Psychrobacter sp. AH5]|uniref:ribonuclease Z n=1 Tax=Psychrobacter sp. AH5 TaxID=2937433 RepID=UPI0033406E76